MSDPIKQMEIEDVLSSIRRLVADEVSDRAVPEALRDAIEPSQAQPDDAVQEPAPAEVEPVERLVLTPALRVSEPEPEAGPVEDTVEETVQQEPQPEPEEAREESVGASDEAEPDQVVDAWEEISLEDRIAELEAAVADRDEEWEPDGSEDATEEEIKFSSLRAAMQVNVPESDGADEPESEPEEQGAPEPAAEAAPENFANEADKGEGVEDAAENMFDEDPDVLDENMLRQLVTDIVREELQGTLGERITRNVRKLVRREINTLLATRDFD